MAEETRFTTTLARRNGGWEIMQARLSIGVANEEVVGKELTPEPDGQPSDGSAR